VLWSDSDESEPRSVGREKRRRARAQLLQASRFEIAQFANVEEHACRLCAYGIERNASPVRRKRDAIIEADLVKLSFRHRDREPREIPRKRGVPAIRADERNARGTGDCAAERGQRVPASELRRSNMGRGVRTRILQLDARLADVTKPSARIFLEAASQQALDRRSTGIRQRSARRVA